MTMRSTRPLLALLLIITLAGCQSSLPRVRINLPWRDQPIYLGGPAPAPAGLAAGNQPSPEAGPAGAWPAVTPTPLELLTRPVVFYPQLARIALSAETPLRPAAWQSMAVLAAPAILPGEELQLVASDANGAWLLVLHRNTLGWIPAMLLAQGAGNLRAAVLEAAAGTRCDGFAGSSLAMGQPWQAGQAGDYRLAGWAFLPGGPAAAGGWTAVLQPGGSETALNVQQLPLEQGGALVYFQQALGPLAAGSEVVIKAPAGLDDLIPFQASFYTADCVQPSSGQAAAPPAYAGGASALPEQEPLRVITLQIVLTSSAPTPLPRAGSGVTQPWEACQHTYLSRLQVGDWAVVSSNPPAHNRVRKMPYTDSPILGRIGPGERVQIIKGPSCSNSYVWWKVSAQNGSLTGWTAEGDLDNYWLLPAP